MPQLQIITMGHPTLRKVAKPVTDFNNKLKSLAKGRSDLMILENGIGLAAPQVNKSIRMIVIDMLLIDEEKYTDPMVFVNPEIIESFDQFYFEEGCLSVPEIREEVSRAKRIKVTYSDLDGNSYTVDVEDELLSVVFQHEIDHLNGILFVDKLSPMKLSMLKEKIDKIKQHSLIS